jgi:hypothetical protein
VDIVGKHYLKNNIEGACDDLMKAAYRMWTVVENHLLIFLGGYICH